MGQGRPWFDAVLRAGWTDWTPEGSDTFAAVRVRVGELVGAPSPLTTWPEPASSSSVWPWAFAAAGAAALAYFWEDLRGW